MINQSNNIGYFLGANVYMSYYLVNQEIFFYGGECQ